MMTLTFSHSAKRWKRNITLPGDAVKIHLGGIRDEDGATVAYMDPAHGLEWAVRADILNERAGRRYPTLEISMGEPD